MRFNGCFRHVLAPECQISFLSRRSRLCGQSRAKRIKLIPMTGMHPPDPHLAVSSYPIYPSPPLANCCLPHPAALSIQRFFPLFFFFSCVLHPVIQQGGELMRPGFLERFVLNCPFCRLSGLAISCHISQVPVVRAGRCHKDPLAVGPWSAGIPSAGIGCVLCPRD